MRRFAVSPAVVTLAVLLSLGGCGDGQGTQGNASALASLDTRLTNAAVPANVAVPAGHAPAAGNAGSTDPVAAPADGAAILATHNAIIAADESAEALGAGDTGAGDTGATFAQGRPSRDTERPVGGCAGRGLRYGNNWASAMPEGLGLYPGARLTEAAGTDTGRCALRAVSFTTRDAPERVVAHYRASVEAAGFDAERQACRSEVRLGGTRAADDAAYMLFARRIAHGVTEVDIVASAGPTA